MKNIADGKVSGDLTLTPAFQEFRGNCCNLAPPLDKS